MIPPMRRRSRELSKEDAFTLLKNGEYGILSTTDSENQPYGTPLSYVVDETDQTIYFHSALKGAKVNNMRQNEKVCFTVVGKTEPSFDDNEFSTYYESVMAFGTVYEVLEEKEKIKALEILCLKYFPALAHEISAEIDRELRITGIWALSISHLSGKAKRKIEK